MSYKRISEDLTFISLHATLHWEYWFYFDGYPPHDVGPCYATAELSHTGLSDNSNLVANNQGEISRDNGLSHIYTVDITNKGDEVGYFLRVGLFS